MASDMAVMESSGTLKVYGPVALSRCSRMHMSATEQRHLDRVPLCGQSRTICSVCRRVLEGTDSRKRHASQ